MELDYAKLTSKLKKIKPYLNSKYLYHSKIIESRDVEYTYHSNAIEGSTLSLKDTSSILEGINVENKSIREILEAVNHEKAIKYIDKFRNNQKIAVNEEEIKKIHALILNNIDDYNAGNYRKVDLGIKGTNIVFPAPALVLELMKDFSNSLVRKQEIGVVHPVKIAAEAHLDFINIHPFIDGNGRTARLLMNAVMLKSDYPILIIKVEDRKNYIKAIEDSRNYNKKEIFEEFIYGKVNESLDDYLVKVNNIEEALKIK